MQSRHDSSLWEPWLQSTLGHLRDGQLLRTLRPTVWCNSSSEALIHRADLDAWVAGHDPVVAHYDHSALLSTSSAALAPLPSSSAHTAPCRSPASRGGAPAPAPASVAVVGGGSGQGGCSCACGSDPAVAAGEASASGRATCRRCGAACGSGSSSSNSSRMDSSSGCGGPRLTCGVEGAGGGSGLGSGRGLAGEGLELVRLRLFSLNDYLGLASHPEVAAATAASATRVGLGPRSSALVAGYTHSHRQLEEALARLKAAEDCLLFPTGFAANLSVMTSLTATLAAPAPQPPTATTTPPPQPPALAAGGSAVTRAYGSKGGGGPGGGDVAIFSDELNHASIIDGARLASRGSAKLFIYRHNDLDHLEELLSATPSNVRRLVVTDSLFSMDGDFADLRGLAALKARHGFLLAVDEAHATLVCGEGGGGAAEAMGVAEQVDLHVGTLSKAFGALGGFVACSRAMKQLLLNRGRAYVYSTSLPVPVVEAAAAALRVSSRETWRRAHVWQLVKRLGDGLGVPALSPVVPLVVGPEGPTLQLSSRLLAEGMHVPAIRPPTVPPGTCRLRVSLSAAHSNADVDDLIRLVQQSAVPLVRLPHLEDERAALPGGAAARGTGTAPLGSGGLTAAAGHVAAASRGAVAQSRL